MQGKYILILVLVSVVQLQVSAQITGKLTNKSGEALAFANVILVRATDSSFINGVTSDTNGVFTIPFAGEGACKLSISSTGYKLLYSASFSVTTENKFIDMGTFILIEAARVLDAVEVTAKKDLLQHTKTGQVINVQNSLMTKGSSALQILERIPGIIIDKRNSTLSLNGQNGVSVMINGRAIRLSTEQLVAMLNGMSGDNIQKIELITSPTAKYDAEGGGGLINIVLKTNKNEGTSVNFSSTLGYGWREKTVTSVNLTHGHKESNYYLGYSFLHDASISSWQSIGSQNVPALGGFNVFDFYSATETNKNVHNFSAGFDHKPNSKTFFGGSFTYSKTNTNPSIFNNATYDFSSNNFLHLISSSKGDDVWKNLQSSLFAEKQISQKTKLSLDADYLFFQNNTLALINSIYLDKSGNQTTPAGSVFTEGNRGSSLSKINIGIFKADLNTKVNEKINLEVGVKGSYSLNKNNSKIERIENGNWVLDTRSQSIISGSENIFGAYSSFNFIINPKTTVTTGLRYEYWRRDFTNYADALTFGQFFPTLLINHIISDNTSISFNYNRRISRPAYNDLASNLSYNDPISVFTGNPLLKPTLTNTFKTEFTFKSMNAGLTFLHEENPIIRYQITTNAAGEIYIVSPQNMAYQNSFNFNFNLPVQVFKWWKVSFGGTSSFRKYQLTHTLNVIENKYFTHNLFINQTMKLPKHFEVELDAWYNTTQYDGATKVKGFGMVNFGIGKKLNKENGILQFAVTDIFRTMRITSIMGELTPLVFDLKSRVNFIDESARIPIFKLTYSRSFGNNSVNKMKQSAADEEKERVRL